MRLNKVSIIVPIYNSEKHLKRCIDSILTQTYRNLEIILVNDGSTDSSSSIIEEYSKQDERIKILNKSNGGQSSARNRGIEICTGDYIAFVDSDDWIVKDIYEYCLKLAKENNSDVVDFQVLLTDEESNEVNLDKKRDFEISIVEGKEILRNYLLRGQTDRAPFSPCRKLYKRQIFDNIIFPEGKINEDITTNYRVLSKASKMTISNKVGYFYYQGGASTTRNGLKLRDFDLLEASSELVELTKNEDYPDLEYLAEVKHARSYFSLLAKIAYYGIEDKTIDRDLTVKNLTKELRKRYLLLIGSPMKVNRKILVTILSINIKLLSIPLKVYKVIFK